MSKGIGQRFSKLLKGAFKSKPISCDPEPTARTYEPRVAEIAVQEQEELAQEPKLELVQAVEPEQEQETNMHPKDLPLPSELLEYIFLYVAYGNKAKLVIKNLEPLMHVNRRWSSIACRLRYLRIRVEDQVQADSFLNFIRECDDAGEQRVPIHHLNIHTPSNKITPTVLPILDVVSHSLRHLRINDQRALYRGVTNETAFSNDPTPDVVLPYLSQLELFWIPSINILTLLGAAQSKLKRLSISARHLDLVSAKPGMLESMYFPALTDMQLYSEVEGWESTRMALIKSSPSLDLLDLTILRSEAKSVAEWVKESRPPSLTILIIYIIGSSSQTDERIYDNDINLLRRLTAFPGWKLEVIP